MKFITRHKILLIAIVLYLAAVAGSVALNELKSASLQFHTRDYNYFIEQAAKLADPRLTNRFALNVDGNNFIGLQGTEGVKSMFQAIHTEYFRYTYTVLYAVFHSVLPIYIFYCALFFLPLIYLAFLLRSTPGAWKQVGFYLALFLLFPGLASSVTEDLRSRMLFVCAWTLMVLAIYYRRPFIEKLLFFGFLLFLREEGIILGIVLMVLDFIRTRRWKQSLVYLGLDVAALAAFIAFMLWGGYTRIDAAYNPLDILAGLLANRPILWAVMVVAALVAAVGVWTWLRRRDSFANFLLLLTYGVGIAMTGFPALRTDMALLSQPGASGPLTLMEGAGRVLGEQTNWLPYYVILLLLILLLDFTRGRWRAFLQGFLVTLGVASIALTLALVPAQLAGWSRQVEPARLVWDFKSSIDRYTTQVLVDYNTYQAFYDVENVIVYNRLPLWMVYPGDRFYPDNKIFLAGLIRSRIQYAVIARTSLSNVSELVSMAGLQATQVASNAEYVVLKLR